MTAHLSVPAVLEEIVQRYDAKEEPFDEFAIGGELNSARKALIDPSEAESVGAWAEVLAFALSADQHENPWNSYFGPMGSGKSTVGKLAAEALGAPLIDIDGLLVREMGMPISQIFGMVGEPRFREMEREAVKAAQAREPCVIVPGGGWAAQPGRLQEAKQSSLVIYLRCLAGTATKRSQQGEARPLLAGVDPVQAMRLLLEEREPFYRQADHAVRRHAVRLLVHRITDAQERRERDSTHGALKVGGRRRRQLRHAPFDLERLILVDVLRATAEQRAAQADAYERELFRKTKCHP